VREREERETIKLEKTSNFEGRCKKHRSDICLLFLSNVKMAADEEEESQY
jgi:hypothetical protein